jgi:FkbM family methyltransferase
VPTTVPILLRLIWQHPANRHRRLRAVAQAALWQAYKHTIARPFDLRVYGQLRLRAYPDSHEPGRFIYYGGLPEFDEMTFMQRYLRPGDGFIDGGANVGAYTLLAALLVGPGGRVEAFEPAPLEAERLRENVALNRFEQVKVHEAALADAVGQAEFTTNRPGSANRLRSAEDEQRQTTLVAVTTIDHTLPDARYAMAKLDLEGAEPLALRGAERHLAACNPPVLALELVDRFVRRFGSSSQEVGEWLAGHGYQLAHYDVGANKLIIGSSLLGSRTNLFAVASEEFRLVSSRLLGVA